MAHDSNHGGVKLYWTFCVILCMITFCEWLIFHKRTEWAVSNVVLVVSLAAMSLIKFTMVVGWYMHLRYDPRLLKQVFIAAFVMVSAVTGGLYVLMT